MLKNASLSERSIAVSPLLEQYYWYVEKMDASSKNVKMLL
jgi:hypothetical protein